MRGLDLGMISEIYLLERVLRVGAVIVTSVYMSVHSFCTKIVILFINICIYTLTLLFYSIEMCCLHFCSQQILLYYGLLSEPRSKNKGLFVTDRLDLVLCSKI
jgi:hypothetical protein